MITLKRRHFLTLLPSAVLVSRAYGADTPAITPSASLKVSPALKAALANPRRATDDIKRDDARKPGETMTFYGIKPGMTVAELMAGKGYFTSVLAETVGDTGKVYGQNNAWLADRFPSKRPLADLIDKQVYKNVVEVAAELEAPLPAECAQLLQAMTR